MTKEKLFELLEDIYLEGYVCGCKGDLKEYFKEYYSELLELVEDEQTK